LKEKIERKENAAAIMRPNYIIPDRDTYRPDNFFRNVSRIFVNLHRAERQSLNEKNIYVSGDLLLTMEYGRDAA